MTHKKTTQNTQKSTRNIQKTTHNTTLHTKKQNT